MADHQVHDLTPEDVSKGMEEGRYLLVDVREPNEVAVEAYPGGVVVPPSKSLRVSSANKRLNQTMPPVRRARPTTPCP